MDEDTMVALALSSSLLEQERQTAGALQEESTGAHSSAAAVLKWRPETGAVSPLSTSARTHMAENIL